MDVCAPLPPAIWAPWTLLVLLVIQDEHAPRRLKVLAESSATQVSAFSDHCQRAWFFERVEGHRTPKQPHQARGTTIDEQLQEVFRTGRVVERPVEINGKREEWSELVRAMADLHPVTAREKPMVQLRLDLATWEGGPRFVGFPDVAYWLANAAPKRWLQVDDDKSTSDFRYAKTRNQLATNVQMIAYARGGYEQLGADLVSVAHVYGVTKGRPRAMRVPALHEEPLVLPRDYVAEAWAQKVIAPLGAMAEAARDARSGVELEPTGQALGHCDRFYGKPCPHRSRCGMSAFSSFAPGGSKMGGEDIAEKIRRLKAGGAPAAAPAATELARGQMVAAPDPRGGGGQTVSGGGPPAAAFTAPVLPGGLADRLRGMQPGGAQPMVGINDIHGSAGAKPLAAQSPGDKGVEGYAPGQTCNGKGWYKSANGQGFVQVEPGHACAACGGAAPEVAEAAASSQVVRIEPGQIVAPEALDKRTSTSADVEAAEAKKRGGRKKKGVNDEARVAAYARLQGAGFELSEIDALERDGKLDEAVALLDAADDATARADASGNDGADVEEAVQATRSLNGLKARGALVPQPAAVLAQAAIDREAARAPIDEPVPISPAAAQGPGAELAALLKKEGQVQLKKPPIPPVIYVDCAPDRTATHPAFNGQFDATSLEVWLAPICELVARAAGKHDWRQIPYSSRGDLATGIRECLDACPAVLVVDSRADAAQVALDVLVPHATLVVRGWR